MGCIRWRILFAGSKRGFNVDVCGMTTRCVWPPRRCTTRFNDRPNERVKSFPGTIQEFGIGGHRDRSSRPPGVSWKWPHFVRSGSLSLMHQKLNAPRQRSIKSVSEREVVAGVDNTAAVKIKVRLVVRRGPVESRAEGQIVARINDC
jgi:hypothetical protein